MKTEKIPYEQIQEIAQDVTREYSPRELPTLEEVSWAFPIEGRERVYYKRNGFMKRIPNTQEGNAMRQVITFKNFKNVLQYLTEGKTIFSGQIPNHCAPCGDADDGAYMVYPYLEQAKLKQENKSQNGFFWETIPNELITAILKVEETGRGSFVDEAGHRLEKIGNIAYVDQELTRQYIQNLKEAYELGRKHFMQVAKSQDKSKDYPQLITERNPETWQKGDEFQWGYYFKKEPQLIRGKVLRNNGTTLDLEIEKDNLWKNTEIVSLKDFGKHGLLWKLIPAQKTK